MKRIIIFALTVALYSCGKSNFTNEKLTNRWGMYYAEEGGNDISDQINGYWMELRSDGRYIMKDMHPLTNHMWELNGDILKIYGTSPAFVTTADTSYTYNSQINISYEVLKLTGKQLWLGDTDPNDKILIKYKRQ